MSLVTVTSPKFTGLTLLKALTGRYSAASLTSSSQQTLADLITGSADAVATLGTTAGEDTNTPLRLPWTTSEGHYAYITGADDNFLSVPDAANLDITGDIDLRAEVSLADWTPGSSQALIAKWTASGAQRSYYLLVASNATISIGWSDDGAGFDSAGSDVAISAEAGARLWVRATLDVDNGSSGNDAKFYTSTDGTTWTQLGSTITGGSTTSIFAGTGEVQIGARNDSVNMTGKVHRAQIYDGIDGTKVLDVNPSTDIDASSSVEAGQTSFTATTGQTVTVNRSATGLATAIVTRSVLVLDGGDDLIDLPASLLPEITATTGKVTAWVAFRRHVSQASTFGRLLSIGTASDNGIHLRFNGSDEVACLVGDGTSTADSVTDAPPTSQIDVAGVVISDGSAKAYLYSFGFDASPSDISSLSTIDLGTAPRVGANAYSVSSEFVGEVLGAGVIKGYAMTKTEFDALSAKVIAGG